MKNQMAFVIFMLMSNLLMSQANVEGNLSLENQTNHENVEILFERQAPSYLSYTEYTDSNGYFSAQIEVGVYDVIISCDGYFTKRMFDVSIYADTLLIEDTLDLHTTILNVPANFLTIQSAIDNAQEGDTVLISEGQYFENIDFNGHNIVVASNYIFENDTSVISNTIIDGASENSVVTFNNNENSSAKLIGLTIQNGNAAVGGGINCNDADPMLMHLKVINNISLSYGGGLYIYNSSNPIIESVLIKGNESDERGGGIFIGDDSSSELSDLLVTQNRSGYKGGGIHVDGNSNVTLLNVVIADNYSETKGGGLSTNVASTVLKNVVIKNNHTDIGGGGILVQYGEMTVYSSIVINNTTNSDGAITVMDGTLNMYNSIIANNTGTSVINTIESGVYTPSVSLNYSNVWDNQTDVFDNCGEYIGEIATQNLNGTPCDAYYNIFVNPLFADASNDNYQLGSGSECIDAGTNSFPGHFSDFAGNQRIWDGNDDGNAVIDMGCYEFNAPLNDTDIVIPQASGNNDNLSVFPNPSRGLLTVKVETQTFKEHTIQVHAVNGKLIYSRKSFQNFYYIDLSKYPKGIYLIEYIDDEIVETQKIVIR